MDPDCCSLCPGAAFEAAVPGDAMDSKPWTVQSPFQCFTHLQLLQDLSMKYNQLWNNLVSEHLT